MLVDWRGRAIGDVIEGGGGARGAWEVRGVQAESWTVAADPPWRRGALSPLGDDGDIVNRRVLAGGRLDRRRDARSDRRSHRRGDGGSAHREGLAARAFRV